MKISDFNSTCRRLNYYEKGSSGTIVSHPEFGNSSYDIHTVKQWNITVTEGKAVRINFTEIDIVWGSDLLLVYSGNNTCSSDFKHTVSQSLIKVFTSVANHMIIVFTPGGSSGRRGFNSIYEEVGLEYGEFADLSEYFERRSQMQLQMHSRLLGYHRHLS
jgi:hypothetical protein